MTQERDEKGKFVKGVSANPGGRPKADYSISALIDEAVSLSDWNFIISILKKKARRGDYKAIEILLDRRFGKPVQPNEHTGKDGAAISLIIEWGDNASNDKS